MCLGHHSLAWRNKGLGGTPSFLLPTVLSFFRGVFTRDARKNLCCRAGSGNRGMLIVLPVAKMNCYSEQLLYLPSLPPPSHDCQVALTIHARLLALVKLTNWPFA